MKKGVGTLAVLLVIILAILAIPFVVAKYFGSDAAGITGILAAIGFGVGSKKYGDALKKRAKKEGEDARKKIDDTPAADVVAGLDERARSGIDAARQAGLDAGVTAGLDAASRVRTVQPGGNGRDSQGNKPGCD